MEYRRMSEEMSSQEVHLLMKVLIPEAEVKSYDRCRDTNCIDVTYCLYGQERVITFYEDDIAVSYTHLRKASCHQSPCRRCLKAFG